MPKKHLETKIRSETLFTGRVVTLTRDEVLLENGKTSTREVVHHGGGAAVVALNERCEVALVRQYRYAVGAQLLELPAGKVESGEDPFETAKRELAEEAGVVAETYHPLGHILPTCGYCTERIHLYLATHLSSTPQHLDADEFLTPLWMPFREAYQLALSGDINDSKTLAGLFRAHALVNGSARGFF